jgi:predicted GIY-YIG superfamily endonuclease
MDDAVLVLSASAGLIHEGTLYGGYAPDDPTRHTVQQTAKEATAAYQEAWQAFQDARQQQAQREAAQRQTRVEAWVQAQHPALVTDRHPRQRAPGPAPSRV